MPKQIAIVSQHDWRLSTVCTREVLGDGDRLYIGIGKGRAREGEVRVGVITVAAKLGDNWWIRTKLPMPSFSTLKASYISSFRPHTLVA